MRPLRRLRPRRCNSLTGGATRYSTANSMGAPRSDYLRASHPVGKRIGFGQGQRKERMAVETYMAVAFRTIGRRRNTYSENKGRGQGANLQPDTVRSTRGYGQLISSTTSSPLARQGFSRLGPLLLFAACSGYLVPEVSGRRDSAAD